MDLKKYPLHREGVNGLLDRLQEEMAETIVVISKIRRFGMSNHHPDAPDVTNRMQLRNELSDVLILIDELRNRGILL